MNPCMDHLKMDIQRGFAGIRYKLNDFFGAIKFNDRVYSHS